ncbi:DUF805 domain-containing protein [Segnochrobactraceae bacterium EtOH-i3]
MPSVTPLPVRAPTIPWALLGFDGRISREVFWLGFGFLYSAGDVILSALLPRALTPDTLAELPGNQLFLLMIVLALAVWMQFALVAKRLHDAGWSATFAIIMAAPLLNLVAMVVVGLLPSEAGPNQYAVAPNQRAPRR